MPTVVDTQQALPNSAVDVHQHCPASLGKHQLLHCQPLLLCSVQPQEQVQALRLQLFRRQLSPVQALRGLTLETAQTP